MVSIKFIIRRLFRQINYMIYTRNQRYKNHLLKFLHGSLGYLNQRLTVVL